MNNPTFSIIIPALNEEAYLPKLLESICGQSEGGFEVIVVDGKSRDKTVEKAEIYKSKIHTLEIVTSPKASLPLQRNLGASRARGEWLVFIDADSILMPYFLERCRKFIAEHESKLLTTWFKPDSEKIGDVIFTLLGNLSLETLLLMKRPFTPGPLTLVKRDIFDAIGGYDETHAFHEDVDFGLRLAKKGVIVQIIRETLYIWSLRRIRKEGTMKVIQQYILSALPVIFFNRSIKYMPGYTMGGQLYDRRKKQIKRSLLKDFEGKFKNVMKELLE